MSTVSPETALAALRWRYAVKKFDAAKKIPPATWTALEHAMVLSPSSYGLQPWKFFVVDRPGTRAKLLPASWGQRQIVDASHLVVFAVKANVGPADAQRLIDRTAEVRGVPASGLEGYKGMMVGSLTRQTPADVENWMTRQVFIALGVFLTAAAIVGVDACPMEGFQPEQYDEILGLSAKGYKSVVLATAGYRHADCPQATAAKVRFPHTDMVEHV
ncbi:MAG TPA: NAD(P)H-dependent oxidoreductase [Fimbriiglobus sp.]|jgi:nitroreductase